MFGVQCNPPGLPGGRLYGIGRSMTRGKAIKKRFVKTRGLNDFDGQIGRRKIDFNFVTTGWVLDGLHEVLSVFSRVIDF